MLRSALPAGSGAMHDATALTTNCRTQRLSERPMWTWTGTSRPPFAQLPSATQESVWDDPRPPVIRADSREVIVRVGGVEVVRTRRALRDHVAIYATQAECLVDGARVRPQDGGFYGGWVTDEIVGPWKGGAGTGGW